MPEKAVSAVYPVLFHQLPIQLGRNFRRIDLRQLERIAGDHEIPGAGHAQAGREQIDLRGLVRNDVIKQKPLRTAAAQREGRAQYHRVPRKKIAVMLSERIRTELSAGSACACSGDRREFFRCIAVFLHGSLKIIGLEPLPKLLDPQLGLRKPAPVIAVVQQLEQILPSLRQ